jgi:hypothetical protein
MFYLGLFLTIYGSFLLLGFLLQFPFFYNNAKSKVIIKWVGIKGFNGIILFLALASITAGVVLLNLT